MVLGGLIIAALLALHRVWRGALWRETLPHLLLDTLLFGALVVGLFWVLPDAFIAPLRPLPEPTALDGLLRPEPHVWRIGLPVRGRDLSGSVWLSCLALGLIIGLGWTRIWLIEHARAATAAVLRTGDRRRIVAAFLHAALMRHGLFDTGAAARDYLLRGPGFAAARQRSLDLRSAVVDALTAGGASPYALWEDYPPAQMLVSDAPDGSSVVTLRAGQIAALMQNPKTAADFERRLSFRHEPFTVSLRRDSAGLWRVSALPERITLSAVV